MNRIMAIIDPNGRDLVGLNLSNHADARALAAGVAESHTVPTGAKYVVFSSTTDFYANFAGVAAIPAADVTDGTASILNPQLRAIGQATAIGLISPAACIVTMEFYA
jgi:hypothetical protein